METKHWAWQGGPAKTEFFKEKIYVVVSGSKENGRGGISFEVKAAGEI